MVTWKKCNNIYLIFFFLDINSGHGNEYRGLVGNDNHYFFASSFFNLSSIETSIMAAIMKCPVPEPLTTDSSDGRKFKYNQLKSNAYAIL